MAEGYAVNWQEPSHRVNEATIISQIDDKSILIINAFDFHSDYAIFYALTIYEKLIY